jgi:hypothetical protein
VPARGGHVRAAQAAHQAQRARLARGEEAKYALEHLPISTILRTIIVVVEWHYYYTVLCCWLLA